ncbi:MAG: hypothetical protein ACE5PM_01895 [Candidatus Hydrothermarchaeales archaeon]
MKTGMLLFLFIIVASIYLLPDLTARYSGSHTMEWNVTGVESLKCTDCHKYILEELNASTGVEVYQRHRAAAGNSTYTYGWLNLTIDNETEYGVCQMCHLAQIANVSSHTKTAVRACIDFDCHGNNETTNNTYYAVGNMTALLAVKNVHERVFDRLHDIPSNYVNETGDSYPRSFYLCLGCHTEVGSEISYYNDTEGFTHDAVPAQPRRYL